MNELLTVQIAPKFRRGPFGYLMNDQRCGEPSTMGFADSGRELEWGSMACKRRRSPCERSLDKTEGVEYWVLGYAEAIACAH